MPLFGYARVSTRDQNLVTQDAELRAAGCAKVFKEKISGAKTDWPELVKAIGRLEPGDVLVVTRLDRLARSTRDLLNVIAAVADRGAGFKSLKDEDCCAAGFQTSLCRLGVMTGHPAMSAQCLVCAKADTAGRFMS